MTAPNPADYMTVRGHRVHLSMATAFIRRLAQARDQGVPVVFQDSAAALNQQQTSPEDVQVMLEEACDVLGLWLDQVRRAPERGSG